MFSNDRFVNANPNCVSLYIMSKVYDNIYIKVAAISVKYRI